MDKIIGMDVICCKFFICYMYTLNTFHWCNSNTIDRHFHQQFARRLWNLPISLIRPEMPRMHAKMNVLYFPNKITSMTNARNYLTNTYHMRCWCLWELLLHGKLLLVGCPFATLLLDFLDRIFFQDPSRTRETCKIPPVLANFTMSIHETHFLLKPCKLWFEGFLVTFRAVEQI